MSEYGKYNPYNHPSVFMARLMARTIGLILFTYVLCVTLGFPDINAGLISMGAVMFMAGIVKE